MDPRDAFISGFKDFIIKAKHVKDYSKILEHIFDMHFRIDNKAYIIRDLNLHITEVFNSNGMNLLLYLQSNEVLSLSEIGLDNSVYKNIFECINTLKIKYGFVIRKLLASEQNSFVINSVETSVANGQSLHNIKISRADGSTLSGLFNTESLMAIITSLIGSLKLSMQQGIYNLNDTTVKNYIIANTEFNGILDDIIASSNEDIRKAVAITEFKDE